MAEFLLSFQPPADPLSMNDKNNRDTGRAKQAWRDRAYFLWCQEFPGKGPLGRRIGPADVFVSLPFNTSRRRDPINFARTVKAIVDGIQMAGAWPDDTLEFVTQNIPYLRRDPNGDVVVRIVERSGLSSTTPEGA